mgnify:CR=1 FL=1
MIRSFSAYIGICSLTIGLVTLVFEDSLPESLKFASVYSVVLVLLGLLLSYYGRHYLKGWLAYLLFSGDE